MRKIYDEDGAGTTHAAETTWYLWDGDRLLAEYSNSGARQRRYAYAGGGFAPVQYAVSTGPGSEAIYDVHTDHLDTPRLLTDQSDPPKVVWRAAYEAFGRAYPDENPDGDTTDVTFNIRFPGQYYDEETQLYYNWFRYYDPSIGRYISADPIGQFGIIEAATDPIRENRIDFLMDDRLYVGNIDVDGFDGLRVGTAHLYNYAVNDPINLIDPTGEVTLRQVSNFAAGFGNVVSLGLTGAINDATGASSVVDECSGAYGAGTAAGWAHAAVTGGLGLARAAGWRAAFSKYKHGGGGFNVSKDGVRRFGADWHSFKHNGVTKSRPHYHRGPTKSQRKKHRPWQGGW